MKIELEKPARDALARALASYMDTELGVEIGGMDAVRLLDFISERFGSYYYNQALRDARTHLRAKMETLEEAFYELEKPTKP